MTTLTVLSQGDVVLKRPGVYTSFPSLAQDPGTGEIVLLFRQARFDPDDDRPGMQAHGLDGSLYTCRFDMEAKAFTQPEVLLKGEDYPPGIIDGFLSPIDNRLFLVFRRYPHTVPVFFAQGPSIGQISHPRVFPSTEMFFRGAAWGRIVAVPGENKLLQVYYGASQEAYRLYQAGQLETLVTRPGVFQSLDGGQTWTFLTWIVPPYLAPGVCANETALIWAGGRLVAVMRTAGEPSHAAMYMATSEDGGLHWRAPQLLELRGEAPMFYMLPDGRVLLGIRQIHDETPNAGGTFSLVPFDPDTLVFGVPTVVEAYAGNRYDGGYGDMVWVPQLNRLLVVYYYSDTLETRNPWLRFAMVDVGA